MLADFADVDELEEAEDLEKDFDRSGLFLGKWECREVGVHQIDVYVKKQKVL